MGARMAMAGPTSMNIPRTRRMAFRAMRENIPVPCEAKHDKVAQGHGRLEKSQYPSKDNCQDSSTTMGSV